MKRIFLILGVLLVTTTISAQQLKVASYNVRYQNNGDAQRGNGWAQRCPVVCNLIEYNDFDIFGAQEVMNGQLNDMKRAMPQYASIGKGREDGKKKGEYAPIFYKKDKFKLVDSGMFWLSETPEVPSVGWDAALTRVCTWAQLTEKSEGYTVWFFNLHLDHVGVKAREESIKQVMRTIKAMCGDQPAILTGDFNVDQSNVGYKLLADSKELFDCYEVAKLRYALNGTFNDFNPNTMTDSRIDHIFVTPQFVVDRYAVLTDTYRAEQLDAKSEKSGNFPKEVGLVKTVARVPSDHFPVCAVLKFK